MKRKQLLIALALLAGFAVRAQVTEFPYTQGFENGLDGWTAIDQDGDGYNWGLSISAVSATYQTAHTGSAAVHSASYDGYSSEALNTNNFLVSPAFELPDGDYKLTWWARTTDTEYPETYSVYVSTEGNTVSDFLATTPVYTHTFTGSEGVYTKYSVSLNDYAGATIYVAFRHHCYDKFSMSIDDIAIEEAGAPVVTLPANIIVDVNTDATITAVLAEGSSAGLGYTWTSTMESNGLATMSADDNVLTINYSAAGTDQVTVTATNSFGTSSATTTVNVRDCSGVTTFPWIESFENEADLDCWTIVDNDNDGRQWQRNSSSTVARTGSYSIVSYSYQSGSNITPDNLLISPAIVLPDEEGFILEYYMAASSSTYCAEHISVYVSTTSDVESILSLTPADSYTLTSADYYNNNPALRSLGLNDYAGQTVYIVFRHHECTGENYAVLDDVTIRQTGAPLFTIGGPSTLQVGQNGTFYVTLNEGVTPSYEWTSTLYENGQGTLTLNDAGDTAVFNYSAGGTDVISVTATNSYGTATVTRPVTIIDCSTPAELPWSANLNSATGVQCWLFVDNDGNNYNWSRSGNGNNAYLQSRGADDWAITPPIQMAANAEGTIVEWSVRGYNGCTYEVWVSPTGGTDIEDFTDSLFAETYTSNSYADRTASLAAYDGQTIRVAFRHTHAGSNNNQIRLRSIGVRQTTAPVITLAGPATIDADSTASFVVSVTEGSLDGMSYSWESVMATAGLATMTENDSLMTITYTAGGRDTITATATNAYGTATATRTVYVRDCSAVTVYPWSVSFAQGTPLDCWNIVDNDGNGATWTLNSSGYLNAPYASAGPDDWAITQPLTIPGEGYVVQWDEYCSNYTIDAHYLLLASPTGGSGLADFTDTLFEETNGNRTWVTRSMSLNNYEGQTIRLAFRHINTGDDDGMRLRNLTVRQTLAPVVSINMDAVVDLGTGATATAVLNEGSTDGIGYTWSSTMESAGQATIAANGATATFSYSATGTDTVTLVVTNSYGTATATRVVTVVDLSPVTSFPYTTGFESGDDQNWLFINPNNGNKWHIGSAASNGGSNSLYISSDNGASNSYVATTSHAYAYRTVSISDPGDYVVTYDWRCYGEISTYSYYDYMRAAVVPALAMTTVATSTQGLSATSLPSGYIAIDGDTYLANQSSWQSANLIVNIPAAGQYAIMFYWVNDGVDCNNPPAAIDNLYFAPLTCPAPTGINVTAVTNSSISISWTAGGSESQWDVTANGMTETVTTNSHTITGLDGNTTYTIQVRAVCSDDDFSTYATATAKTDCDDGSCSFTLDMTDSYGDGWADYYGETFSYIRIMQGGTLVRDVTLSSGYSGSETVSVCAGQPITLSWISNEFDDECGLTIVSANGTTLYTHDGFDDMNNNQEFFTFDADCNGTGDNPNPQPDVCNAPTGLHATATTQTSLTFDWTAGGSEEQWQLEVDGQAQVANAHPYTVSGLQPGTNYSVRVRAICGSNDYSNWTAAVTASTDEQVGISNFEIQNSEFELSPNPATSEVTVSVNNLEIQNSKFEILTLHGQVVDQFEIHNSKFTIDLTSLPAGVYFVRLQGASFSATRKLVVR